MSYRGLQKQTHEVRFGAGINQSQDEWLVDAPSVLRADNVRFDTLGAMTKRYGSEALSATGAPSSLAGTLNSIFDHQGKLVIWGPGGAYGYDEQVPKWARTNVGSPRPSRVFTDPLIRGNNSLLNADIAVSGDVMCAVWVDKTELTIRYAFYDATSLALLSGPTELHATNMRGRPRILTIDSGARFVIVGTNAGTYGAVGTLYISTYQLSADTYTFAAPISLGVATGSGDEMDCCTDGGTHFTVMYRSGGNSICLRCTNAGATVSTKTINTFVGLAVMHNTVLDTIVAVDGTGQIARFPEDYSGSVTKSTLLTPTGALTHVRATICQLDSTGRMFVALSPPGHGDFSGGEPQFGTDIVEVSTSYGAAKTGYLDTVALAAKAFYTASHGAETAVVPLANQVGCGLESPEVSTGFVWNPTPYGVIGTPITGSAGDYTVAEVGRFLIDRIDKVDDEWHLSASVDYNAEVWFNATVVTDLGPALAILSERKLQIDLVRARLYKTAPVRSVTAQSIRVISGGAGVSCYDGQQLAEMTPCGVNFVGHDNSTEDISVSGNTVNNDGGSGGGDAVTYTIKLVHRWVDAQGNVHRGAPSGEYVIDGDLFPTGIGTTHNGIYLLFSPPGPTALNGDRLTYHDTEIYQTDTSAPGDYYLIGVCTPQRLAAWPEVLSVTLCMGAAARPSYAFGVVNYELLTGFEPAYFNDERINTPTPPMLDVVSTQSRVWGLSAENRLEVWYTKPMTPGRAPEFSSEQVIQVPHEGGDCVGIAAVDDNIIVFKERQVYAIFGDPGDASGAGSTVQNPRLISSDVGCSNVNSIVEGPFGVAFQSERGLYTLERGQTLTFVGANVKDQLDGVVITSGVLVSSQSEVRWTLDSDGRTWNTGTALVWNYRVNAWSYWTDLPCVHACVWRGRYTRLTTSVTHYTETVGEWGSDEDEDVVIETPWFKLAGIKGFMRIWRTLWLLRWYTGYVTIETFVDYDDDTAINSAQWTVAELGELQESGAPPRLQLMTYASKQKVESIKFRITGHGTEPIEQGAPTPGQGLELIGLEFEVGTKRGASKDFSSEAKG